MNEFVKSGEQRIPPAEALGRGFGTDVKSDLMADQKLRPEIEVLSAVDGGTGAMGTRFGSWRRHVCGHWEARLVGWRTD